jgi:hypothetical protein
MATREDLWITPFSSDWQGGVAVDRCIDPEGVVVGAYPECPVA